MDGGLNSCSEYREKCRGQRNYVQRRVVFKAIRAFSLGSLSNCMAENPSLSGRSHFFRQSHCRRSSFTIVQI